jgi:hypothetical protein
MVVETHTLPDPQNACVEANALRERLKAAARHLDVWLLLVFELVFLADAERKRAFAASCADLRAKTVEGLRRAYTFSYEAQNSTRLSAAQIARGRNP